MLQICCIEKYPQIISNREVKKMKKIYETPKLESIIFKNADIVRTSDKEMEYDPQNPSGDGGKTEW